MIREQQAEAGGRWELLGEWWAAKNVDIEQAELCEVSLRDAAVIIKQYEYLGTMPNAPVAAFGIRWGGDLAGVIVFGMPSPPNVARSVVDPTKAGKVIQLSRGACVHWAHPHSASKLIAYGLREMGLRGWGFAIAYADPDAGEIGTVYQATNWLYCGLTASRPDYFDASGKRMVGHFRPTADMTRGPRTRKHRYVALLGDKRQRRINRKFLRWPVLDQYPKRETVAEGGSAA
jgi:hypothetical protein